jgi:glyoxylase I family protein
MSDQSSPKAQPVLGLHHSAYRCRDAEETRHFYEDILGLPLAHVIQADDVPSTGDNTPFLHLFFELTDKSCIAFFDLGDGVASEPSPNTPAWVNHIAFKVPSTAALDAMKRRLEAHGVKVLGVTDHEFVHSIYFFDPNGIRLELTTQVVGEDQMQRYKNEAHEALKSWTGRKTSRPVAASA